MAIAPETRMGAVHLTVADLDRSRRYYEDAVGLRVLDQDRGTLRLGAPRGEALLALHEERGARPVDGGHTGLFHFALLLPRRVDLARWLVHAARNRVPITGASEHYVSEAIYLRDPDHHGIEIYRDRPREQWWDDEGNFRLGTAPLDLDDLFDALEGDEPFEAQPAGTTMGHVHLHVADVEETVLFYGEGGLGFETMALIPDQAAFLGAGGYHHHVGGNVWAGRGVGPPPPGTAALRHATILVPDAGELDRVAGKAEAAGGRPEPHDDGVLVTDPGGNRIVLSVA
jgi:catechol 2,3-dioxygenase